MVNGLYPPDNGLNEACKRARKIVENNPHLVIIYDFESGWPEIVSKDRHEKFMKMWDDCIPKFDGKLTGTIIMFGTGGDMDKSCDFNK